MLINIKNIQPDIDLCAGAAVAVELRMRFLGELSEQVRENLKKNVKEKTQGKNRKSDKYWDCNLEFLDQTIEQIFNKKLTPIQQNSLLKFRPMRNKILHADFIKLIKLLDIVPIDQDVLSEDGKKNVLNPPNVNEAILNIKKNEGFKKFLNLANEVIVILDELIHSLESD